MGITGILPTITPGYATGGPDAPQGAQPGAPPMAYQMAHRVAYRVAPSLSERTLLETVQRQLRAPGRRMALVLHLSRLTPPAPRPHHRRIARALLQETAQLHDGQVFPLGNGDLVLLCSAASDHPPRTTKRHAMAVPPGELPAVLARLMRMDAPDPWRLVSSWMLRTEAEAILAYAHARVAETAAPLAPPDDGFGETSDAIALLYQIETEAATDLLHRQTAVLVQGTARSSLRPLFFELTFSIQALAIRAGIDPARPVRDPFLLRHLAEQMDTRLLRALQAEAATQGPLSQMRRRAGPMLHINLTLAGAETEDVADLLAQARMTASPLGVEIALMDACADLDRFHRVRNRLQQAGALVVIDRISHLALTMTDLSALHADLFKLDWSAAVMMLDPADDAALRQALVGLGLHRLVLQGADAEAALHWGLGQGICRFQGRHVDAMLAAKRIMACPHAVGCNLAQCTERAATTGQAGRMACQNPPLLDGVLSAGLPRSRGTAA